MNEAASDPLGTPPMLDGRPAFAGRLLVKKLLQLDSWNIERLHPEPGSLQTLARLIAHQARELDRIDEQLRRDAVSAIERLTQVLSGERSAIQSHGILRILGSDLETLSARYDQMAELLEMGAAEYRLTVVEQAEAARRPASRVRGTAAAARVRGTRSADPNAGQSEASGTRPPASPGERPTRSL